MIETLAAIEKDKFPREGHRGLIVYFDEDNTISEKVDSANQTVEEWEGKLWGVMVTDVNGKLNDFETRLKFH